MRKTFPAQRSIYLLILAFILCGLGHVFLYGKDLWGAVSQFFCGSICMIWAVSVQKRVTDRRIRNMLLLTAATLVTYMLVQSLKYNIRPNCTRIIRYCWYGYYLCMMAALLFCYLVSLNIYKEPGVPASTVSQIPSAAMILVSALVMTNDLHQLFVRFGDGPWTDKNVASYGHVYFLFYADLAVSLIISCVVIFRKFPGDIRSTKRALAFVPFLFNVVYLILNFIGKQPRLCGIVIWQMGEFFSFSVLIFLEICISYGMIPANHGYEVLFSRARFPAAILDTEGRLVYSTEAANWPFAQTPGVRISRSSIGGGCVEWVTDLSTLNEVNARLEEASEKLEEGNAFLEQENQIKAESAELEMRNRIYDRVREAVSGTLERMSKTLASDAVPEEKLRRTAFLGVYVKRRSNMEILRAGEGFSAAELAAAVRETLSYVNLFGITTAFSNTGSGACSCDMMICAYDDLAAVLGEVLDTAKDLAVNLRYSEGGLRMRLMIGADGLSVKLAGTVPEGVQRDVGFTSEGGDLIVTITYSEGGRQ